MLRRRRANIWFFKNLFKGWNTFEMAMLFVAIFVPVVVGIIFDSTWLQIVASSSTAVVVLFFAKAKVEGYVISVIAISSYVIVAWGERLFGEVIIQLSISTPIVIVGFIAWLRSIKTNKDHGRPAEITIATTSIKELLIVIPILVVAGVGIYFLLLAFDTPFVLVSTISVVFSLAAAYFLLIRKSFFGTFGYVLNDVSQIILWTSVLIVTENFGILPIVIMATILLILDTYAIFTWRKMYKRQRSGLTR